MDGLGDDLRRLLELIHEAVEPARPVRVEELRELMALIYEAVTGEALPVAEPAEPPAREPAPAGASKAFLAEFAAWRARRDVA